MQREEDVENVLLCLKFIGRAAKPALPVLTEALASTNATTREKATNALADIAPEVLGIKGTRVRN